MPRVAVTPKRFDCYNKTVTKNRGNHPFEFTCSGIFWKTAEDLVREFDRLLDRLAGRNHPCVDLPFAGQTDTAMRHAPR